MVIFPVASLFIAPLVAAFEIINPFIIFNVPLFLITLLLPLLLKVLLFKSKMIF